MLAYDGNDFLQMVQAFSSGDPSMGRGDRCIRFGGVLLFDSASSVSVCVFCT